MFAFSAILATALLLAGADAQAVVPYHVVDLGTLGGTYSFAHGVNADGDVVGEASTADAATHAFLYHAGALTDLGTLPGGTYSVALAINASGLVVGYADTAEGDTHAVTYTGGTGLVDLGIFPGVSCTTKDEPCSIARAVNDLGTAVGDAQVLRNGKLHRDGFALDQGKPFTLGTPPDVPGSTFGGSLAVLTGINSHRHTSGYACPAKTSCAQTATGYSNVQAFYYSLSGTVHPLGVLASGDTSLATAINESDQVVGGANATPGGPLHAFLSNANSSNRSLFDLGTLGGPGSIAYAINGLGQIVGTAQAADGTSHAAFWQGDGTPAVDLAALLPVNPGWTLTVATDINDGGAIVGSGTLGGQTHAFLMLPGPAPSTTTTVTTSTTTTTALGSRLCGESGTGDVTPCLLRALGDAIAAAPSVDLRSPQLRFQLEAMVSAARFRVESAGVGRKRTRRLRQARQKLSAFLAALRRGTRRGQITADLAAQLRTLALGVREQLTP